MADPHDLPPPPSLQSLRQRGAVSLFLDFDGTLVEIAEGPDAIAVPEDLATSLAGLGARLGGRLALISGRALDDIEYHLGELNIARAGSHGGSRLRADGSRVGQEPSALPDLVMADLHCFAEPNGLRLERKSHGAALHYRSRPESGERAAAYAEELAAAHGLATKRGKCVIELVWPGADKGGAVHAFMQEAPFAGTLPVFIGDDVTDEDGFAAAEELGGFGILVGKPQGSRARYALSDVAAVYDWLGL